jgi:hypothetical protein
MDLPQQTVGGEALGANALLRTRLDTWDDDGPLVEGEDFTDEF